MGLVRSSGFSDPGWEHGVAQDSTKKRVKCIYCGKIVSGDGGGSGDDGGGSEVKSAAGQANTSTPTPDVIILDVGGMVCGGCAASVKRILEGQPQVSSASVNLTTEAAVVWAIPGNKVAEDWKQELGEKLANKLTTCGFKSKFRDSASENLYKVFERKMDERLRRLNESGRELAVSWALCAVCLLGHVSHLFAANAPSWIHTLHSTNFHLSLSLITFIGPGRKLIFDGLRSLFNGSPNMNTLVGLGALSSFAVSSIAAFIPKLGWKTFFEEPLPVAKLPGTEVTAGSINLNGTLTVEVRRPGGETVMGDIVHLMEEAQAREAPVQRLADKVAGNFTYGVMAFSAATFMFWSLFGSKLVPAALQQGSISLAFQLLCSVLVVACPCALGLATPTAVLVGTSLGATRVLLLRGGNVLEKFAEVDTIIFDKTGTLTIGRPVVTKVTASQPEGGLGAQTLSNNTWTEVEILRLAAGVEANTNHPVGKGILEAARVAGCHNVKATDRTFREEPGSGAVATVESKLVTVGTLNWLRRNGVMQKPLPDTELGYQSVVYVGIDGDLAGLIYFEDKIREDARQVVESLSKQGISIYMLSGDKKSTAEYVASIVGIRKDRVLSEVKPEEKKNFICKLQKNQNVVAMVGDGINDAAALASSDVGIAMGEGVGAASDASSIVLMGNRLPQLLDALELSKMTMQTVKQNLWWAFAYNIVGIPIAAGILLPVNGMILTPSLAGALMGFSSVGVMANSLLLRLKLASKHKPAYTLQEETKPYTTSESRSEKPSPQKLRSA